LRNHESRFAWNDLAPRPYGGQTSLPPPQEFQSKSGYYIGVAGRPVLGQRDGNTRSGYYIEQRQNTQQGGTIKLKKTWLLHWKKTTNFMYYKTFFIKLNTVKNA
jgi:hypothetical protein